MNFLSRKKIDLNKILINSKKLNAGAVVIFMGVIRADSKNKKVKYVYYESYTSMANKMIENILNEAKARWKLLDANVIHRIGKVNVNDIAVIVITQHYHRKQAYKANMYIIDQIKQNVPIWKCEYYSDGTYEWSPNLS